MHQTSTHVDATRKNLLVYIDETVADDLVYTQSVYLSIGGAKRAPVEVASD